MATTYTNDQKHKALKAWLVNHPEVGTTIGDMENKFYTQNSFTDTQRSGYDLAGRIARFQFVAGLLALPAFTYGAANPAEFENEFWTKWAALPPTPLA